jgi:hypothetical protein
MTTGLLGSAAGFSSLSGVFASRNVPGTWTAAVSFFPSLAPSGSTATVCLPHPASQTAMQPQRRNVREVEDFVRMVVKSVLFTFR